MKRTLLTLASALAALLLPGCFQSETTVHLNKDGSGTIIEENRLGAQMLAMIDQMASIGGENAKQDPLKEMFSEEKAKTRATALGEGVTFDKIEMVNANGAKGARTAYRFKDINTLKIATDDGMKNMSPAGREAAPVGQKSVPIAFSYAAGKLSIKMPDAKPAAAPEAPVAGEVGKPDMNSPEAQAMMKQMFTDMKMSLKVVIDSGIIDSNATHKDGNTITLMEMDMNKLLENPETLKKLGKVDQNDPSAAMDALKNLNGVKMETQKEVTITVK
jgi:hypothetical protein